MENLENKTQSEEPAIETNKDIASQQTNNNGAMTKSSDETNMALLNWLGCLFFGFIPPLIIFLTNKEETYVKQQSREALNWSITALISYFALWVMSFILGLLAGFLGFIPLLFIFVIAISHLVFCILGAIKCSNGDDFKVPFNIRLIK